MMDRLTRKVASRALGALGMGHLKKDLAGLRSLLERSGAGTVSPANNVSQLILLNQYRDLLHGSKPLPSLADVEFRAFSQQGEDGILLYVFALLGMGERRCVEICAGDGIECNTANLIVNHGWNGLLFDGDKRLVEKGRAYYSRLGDTSAYPPAFVNAWITRENVNELLKQNGFVGPVDLLSLDLDGVDYWIWQAIDVIRPRVVIAEVQCIWGADRSVSVPYSETFKAPVHDRFKVYCGASLPAFAKLARAKGYRLVGVQRLGFNAVFVAQGIGEELLPEVDIACCTDRPFVNWARRELLPKVAELEWVEV
jgi:hypothetical protein